MAPPWLQNVLEKFAKFNKRSFRVIWSSQKRYLYIFFLWKVLDGCLSDNFKRYRMGTFKHFWKIEFSFNVHIKTQGILNIQKQRFHIGNVSKIFLKHFWFGRVLNGCFCNVINSSLTSCFCQCNFGGFCSSNSETQDFLC